MFGVQMYICLLVSLTQPDGIRCIYVSHIDMCLTDKYLNVYQHAHFDRLEAHLAQKIGKRSRHKRLFGAPLEH